MSEDYCRTGAAAPNDPNIFCSGGYDNTINVLDLRSEGELHLVLFIIHFSLIINGVPRK